MTKQHVLAVFAHPDDESLLAGGTLAACAAAGCDVSLLCLTRGELGPISDPSLATRQTLGSVRAAELACAGRLLGTHRVSCLGHPDGGLMWADAAAIEADLVRHMREDSPDVVITFGPEGLYWHQDHIAVHRLVVAAVRSFRGDAQAPQLLYVTWSEGLVDGMVSAMRARGMDVNLWGVEAAAFGVPISTITTTVNVSEFLPLKLRALRAHRSQLDSTHLFYLLPDDVAHAYLSQEYFILSHAGSVGEKWLETIAESQRSG